ncbi:MFS transporter [Streptantibioticus rubrisoli]|uniref:MFS transporter n=1 Tax=Streptantibioticus rubrisoli TaxID=1387313 RepID=A0ABT1P7E7_9ACTN|nr:MFS transporter [Streptantibioticus rubrisoli]MCQ4041307.1 MFS transporter [Streptantibioticus rubrisoli]
MTRVARRLAGLLLPDGAAGRMLALGACVDSLGTGMFFASATLYFVGMVGIPATKVAFATTLAGALALLAPVPLGRLADRAGTGTFYMVLLLLRGLGYSAYAFVTGYPAYLVLTVLLTALDRSSTPIQQAVVTAAIGGGDRTRTMASIRAVRNIGLTVGFLLAGAVFASSSRGAFTVLFLANGVSFLVVAGTVRLALARTGTTVRREPAPGGAAQRPEVVRSPLRDWWFMVFTVGNGVLSLYDTVLVVLLPVWVIQHTSIASAWVPVLMAVNTVLTVVLQVYVARFAETAAAAVRLLVLAGALMMACCGFFALGQAQSTGVAVAAALMAVVMLSVAENLHSVAAWELSSELAPPAARARYLGAFSLSLTGQKVVGPTLLVVVLLPTGLIAWPVLAGAFGCAALVCRTAARRSLAERAGHIQALPSTLPTTEVTP